MRFFVCKHNFIYKKRLLHEKNFLLILRILSRKLESIFLLSSDPVDPLQHWQLSWSGNNSSFPFQLENSDCQSREPPLAECHLSGQQTTVYDCWRWYTTYDASFGIVTGFRWPLSGKMQTAALYFWLRFRDFSLCFMTWGIDEPAAEGGDCFGTNVLKVRR